MRPQCLAVTLDITRSLVWSVFYGLGLPVPIIRYMTYMVEQGPGLSFSGPFGGPFSIGPRLPYSMCRNCLSRATNYPQERYISQAP